MHDVVRSRRRVVSLDGFTQPGQARPQPSAPAPHRPFVDPHRLRSHAPTPTQPTRPVAHPVASLAERSHHVSPPTAVPAPARPTAVASPLQMLAAPKRQTKKRHARRSRRADKGTTAFGAAPAASSTGRRRSLKHWLTHWSRRKIIKVSLLSVLIAILLGAGWVGWRVYRGVARATNNNNPLSLLGAFKPVPLKNTNGRVNILLAGNSADDPGHDGANLTDSIMVLSLDTKTKQTSMLSIPRDLWVSIPGDGHQKINAAGALNSFRQAGYPDGGMGQLEQIVTQNLAIPIHYYALINYSAFRDLVNAVGGVTVSIQSPDPRGLYDPNIGKWEGGPLKLANGPQALDGQTALNLARARGDSSRAYGFPQSDFDRTTHQRQILLALKDKITASKIWTNPLKIAQLADAVGKNVKTDMKIAELETFYNDTKNVKNDTIASFNLNDLKKGQTLLANYTSPNGQSALIPAAGLDDFSQIQTALDRLFSADPLVREGATVVVLNGGNIAGLARQEADALKAKKLDIVAVADAPQTIAVTEIIDNSKGAMPTTKQALQQRYGNHFVASDPAISGYTADFIVVLGQNQAAPTPPTPPSTSTTTH